MAIETIHYETISSSYTAKISFQGFDDNVAVLENALDIFAKNGHTRVCDYTSMTGLENDYHSLFDTKKEEGIRFNRYYNAHFTDFEKFLAQTCGLLAKLISYKKHKEALLEIENTLYGYRDPSYSDGLCGDFLNDVTDEYIENGVITEKRANRIHENVFEQFCLMQEVLIRFAKKIIKIIKEHELPFIFKDYPYGEPEFGY